MGIKEQIDSIQGEIREQGYSSICFWMPIRSVCGASIVFAKFAQNLSEYTDLQIYYVDVTDGYARKILMNNEKIYFIDYEQDSWYFPINEPVIIFTNPTRIIQLKNMNPKNKVLILHPDTTDIGWNLLYFQNEYRKIMKLLKKTNSIVFQDWTCRDLLSKQTGTNFQNEDYIQLVLSPLYDNRKRTSLVKNDEINVTWLGRLATDKLGALYNLIDNYASLVTSRAKRLHIIGDGESSNHVKAYCEKHARDVKIIMTGTLYKERSYTNESNENQQTELTLDEYLIKNVDIVFAMGTSALEGAKLGIPSAVVYTNSKPHDKNEFFWLYDMKDYCLGMDSSQKSVSGASSFCLDHILNMISDNERFIVEGEKCYRYYFDNHSNDANMVYKILLYCQRSKLTFDKIKQCLKYIPYNNVIFEELKSFKVRFYSKLLHGNRQVYKLFGVTILTKELAENHTVYRLFGKIKFMHKFIRKAYVFRTEWFKG